MCLIIEHDPSIPIPKEGWKVFTVKANGRLRAVYFHRGMTYLSSRWNHFQSPIKEDQGIHFFLSREDAEDWATRRSSYNPIIRRVKVKNVVALGKDYGRTVGAAKDVYIFSENKSKGGIDETL